MKFRKARTTEGKSPKKAIEEIDAFYDLESPCLDAIQAMAEEFAEKLEKNTEKIQAKTRAFLAGKVVAALEGAFPILEIDHAGQIRIEVNIAAGNEFVVSSIPFDLIESLRGWHYDNPKDQGKLLDSVERLAGEYLAYVKAERCKLQA